MVIIANKNDFIAVLSLYTAYTKTILSGRIHVITKYFTACREKPEKTEISWKNDRNKADKYIENMPVWNKKDLFSHNLEKGNEYKIDPF